MSSGCKQLCRSAAALVSLELHQTARHNFASNWKSHIMAAAGSALSHTLRAQLANPCTCSCLELLLSKACVHQQRKHASEAC